ncbi:MULTISPECIES: transporter substrate-binding domain-containing protein [Brenneria]
MSLNTVNAADNAEKTIEVVVNANGFPFSFVDDDDHISGYDGELLQIIDKRLKGYKFHFNTVSRDAIIVGLSTGAYTLAANHFYLTKERAEKYEYSKQPSGISDLRLIVRKDDNTIRSLHDLAAQNKKLVPIHTNDARYIVIENYNLKHPDNKINLQPTGEQSAADMFKSVASGEYDAVVYPIGAFLAVTKAIDLNLKVADSVGLFPNVFLYNKQTDQAFIKEVDDVLAELKNDGTLAELSKKWYSEDIYGLEGAKDVKVNTDWE